MFIVGMRKAGTSSLYHYLSAHPDIFMCPVKEPHYFSFHLPYHIHLFTTEKQYARLFHRAGEQRWVGEASTSYLDSPKTAEKIARFNQNAKIIVMLREPMDVVHSLHYEFLFRGRGVRASLDEELRLQAKGENPIDYRRLLRQTTSSIKRYLELFGPEHVHFIDFGKFASDTPGAYQNTLRFLGVQNHCHREFRVHNSAAKPRNALVLKLLNSSLARMAGRAVYRVYPDLHLDPFFTNRQAFERPTMSNFARDFLRPAADEFSEQVADVKAHLGV